MDRTLVIDCATDACSAALFGERDLISGQWELLRRGHAERLVPMIGELPDRGHAARVVVALGPGSFTGIRVGLAAGRALALAWGSELLGYSTLAILAAQARAELGEKPIAVVNTGGHGEWFVQTFDDAGDSLGPAVSLPPETAIEAIDCPHICGNQAEAFIGRRGFGTALTLWPDARKFALLPAKSLTGDVRPAYGRAPDAKLPAAKGTRSQ